MIDHDHPPAPRQEPETIMLSKSLQTLLRADRDCCTELDRLRNMKVRQMLRIWFLAAAVTPLMSAGASPLRELGNEAQPQSTERAAAMPGIKDARSVRARFQTLDQYLAYLERRAAIDGAWYRQIRPGIYRLEVGNLRGAAPGQRVFTREQLERRFGFRR
jgi:hypothetical protein